MGSVGLESFLFVSVLPDAPAVARILFVMAALVFAWAAFWCVSSVSI